MRAPTYRILMAYTDQVKTMVNLGIIEPSKSAWSALIVCVRKSDGTIRITESSIQLPKMILILYLDQIS